MPDAGVTAAKKAADTAADASIKNMTREIAVSKKYSGIDSTCIERVCREAFRKYRSAKDAVKAAKKELHIICAAFARPDCYERAGALLGGYAGGAERTVDAEQTVGAERGDVMTDSGLPDGLSAASPDDLPDIMSDRRLARELLALHASTAERLARAEEIYARIGAVVGAGDSVADLGCGFGPFALPFYPARPRVYAAYDIDARMVLLLNRYFALAGTDYRAELYDAAAPDAFATPDAAPTSADVLLMLKFFPLLERQRKGRGFAILASARFRDAVVSFPTRSASGRDRGMEAFYGGLFERGLPPDLRIADKRVYTNEIFYFLQKRF